MDADQLLFYLRGAFENCPKANQVAWENIRAMVFMSHPVALRGAMDMLDNADNRHKAVQAGMNKRDCGCTGFSSQPLDPVLQADKL